jgi:hypothetical protein
MRQIRATIEGLEPGLLMHNIAGMKQNRGGAKKAIPTPQEEALASLYWLDPEHSSLSIPADNLHASFLRAAPKYKIGKQTLTGIISSALHIGPEQISLNTKDYQIDIRSVVVQKNRIFRARAKVFPWSATFSIFFDEDWLGLDVMEQTFPELIKTAGKLIGVLDYRPEKKGRFGTYRLVRYELLPAAKQVPVPEPEIVGFLNIDKTKPKKAAA